MGNVFKKRIYFDSCNNLKNNIPEPKIKYSLTMLDNIPKDTYLYYLPGTMALFIFNISMCKCKSFLMTKFLNSLFSYYINSP